MAQPFERGDGTKTRLVWGTADGALARACGEEGPLLRVRLLPCRYYFHLLVSAASVPSSATSTSPGNRWTWTWHSCPGLTARFMPLGSASPMQVGDGRAGSTIHFLPGPLSSVPSLSAAGEWGWPLLTPSGIGSGHRHGHQLQRELSGLLRAVREAAASSPAAPLCLQPGALHRRAGQPLGRAAGHPGRHGCQHRQRLCHWPHTGMPRVGEEGWQGMRRQWNRRCGGPAVPRLSLSQHWKRQVCMAEWGGQSRG